MADLIKKWQEGLTRTRDVTFGRISAFFGNTEITESTWEDLEALFIQADLGYETTELIIENSKRNSKERGYTRYDQLQGYIHQELVELFPATAEPSFEQKPYVIMLVGVNGSGKTTTAAKLAYRYKVMGKKVLLVAADTFRAAATQQLEIWSKRLQIPLIAGQQDADPGAIAFDGINSGLSRGSDIVIVDTAGRLHTKFNLMEEIKKVRRVSEKVLPGSPQAIWLVLDATTGQNALHQAEAFNEAVDLTGVVLAKLDSSAKGGMAFAIHSTLNLPIVYAGLGEKLEDLQVFDRTAFVDSILRK